MADCLMRQAKSSKKSTWRFNPPVSRVNKRTATEALESNQPKLMQTSLVESSKKSTHSKRQLHPRT